MRQTPNNKHLITHLPIAADQKNSAFQHIGYMMGDDGNELLERSTSEEDIYRSLGDELKEVPKKHRRKIAKMILVPWSYGGTEYSCRKKLEIGVEIMQGKLSFLIA